MAGRGGYAAGGAPPYAAAPGAAGYPTPVPGGGAMYPVGAAPVAGQAGGYVAGTMLPVAAGMMPVAVAAAEKALMTYLEESYMMDTPLLAAHVQSVLQSTGGALLSWQLRSEEGSPLLHLACINEASDPDEITAVIRLMVAGGADPHVKDDDGDSALQAVMSLSEDADRQSEGDADEELEATKTMHVNSVRALLSCPELHVALAEVNSICQWLRRHSPEACREAVLGDLRLRAGEAMVTRSWRSEELLSYLEQKAYDQRVGIEASKVEDFLARGASPAQRQNGATALLLVVLNPYSPMEELDKVFRLMLAAEPTVATIRDGFKLAPVNWASDYDNVAKQHGLPRPNPAALLTLLPAIVAICPPEVDCGEACLKVASDGQCSATPPRNAPTTRFLEGQRVFARVEAPGGETCWEEGIIVGMWYREGCWPETHPGAPYEIRLVVGTRVFAVVDHDRIVRTKAPGKAVAAAAAAPRPSSEGATAPDEAGGRGESGAVAAAAAGASGGAAAGPRFRKRQAHGGEWELLDTHSGKARPCSPPDSDEEDS